jgi:uncharacterized membrane protein YsdA (DUF1294 family)
VYGYDKLVAIRNNNGKNISRISENKLLFIAFIGGIFGSISAMIIFRHKIKKVPFVVKFILVLMTQIVIFWLYIYYFLN